MSVARRPLLTAIVAGLLLCALWFVPSANASVDPGGDRRTPGGGSVVAPGTGAAAAARALRLAETGSLNTTPYLIGGTGFLGLGIGFVAYAVRRRGSDPM
ncbi:hypothetical protein ABT354_18905 [Streptomyces sp. NPDC000594]|uniref:hypothetical protein n=1 Tax=Streptomyces sp. NPDC000594 TaxID=3154261 RepID=UPI00332FACD0